MFPLHHHMSASVMQCRTQPYEFFCLYLTGFKSLHYTWVKACHKGLAKLDLQVSAVTIGYIGTQAILLEHSCSQAIHKFHSLNTLVSLQSPQQTLWSSSFDFIECTYINHFQMISWYLAKNLALIAQKIQFLTPLNQVVLPGIKKSFEGDHFNVKIYWVLPHLL